MSRELIVLVQRLKDTQEARRQIGLVARALTAPIIMHKCGWMEDVPKWLLDYIKTDRLKAMIKGEYDGKATDAEALAYLMPASLEAPLGHRWSRIYLYLATKVMKEAKSVEVPEDVAVETLEKEEERMLNNLKKWIWMQQEKAERRKKREQKR